MSKHIGKNLTCDRCGDTVFLKRVEEDTVLDGGFTRIENFETAPEGWKNSFELDMDLCPRCSDIWEGFKARFKGADYASKDSKSY